MGVLWKARRGALATTGVLAALISRKQLNDVVIGCLLIQLDCCLTTCIVRE